MKRHILFISILLAFLPLNAQKAQKGAKTAKAFGISHNKVGDSLKCDDNQLTIRCIGQKHGYGSGSTYDADIRSPKSAIFLPHGEKFYVNSLEGCKTVVYQTDSLKKIKVIPHDFKSGKGDLWLPASGYYEFTHYPDGENKAFMGKPVESALSRDGRYLFIPYYRRTFDINAQDPSALAVIDTKTDEIILMTETGPLPKMVEVSNDGKLLAITHWGNNTVGFLDISDKNPKNWRHLPPITIDHKLNLNYSLTKSIDRDSGSGYALRGTVFLPGDSIMLVCGMGGQLAIVDTKKMEWLGWVPALDRLRHIVLAGDKLYMSRNATGEVLAMDVDSVVKAVNTQRANSRSFKINGVKTVKVGGGARTLKTSPDGKYIFVACNTSSALYVVDAASMKVIGNIKVDSYPVGLDVSPDGRLIVVTSQGRKGGGGNAVNIFEVDYPGLKDIKLDEAFAPLEENSDEPNPEIIKENNEKMSITGYGGWIAGGVIVLAAISGALFYKFRKA